MTYIQEEWKPVVGYEGAYLVSNCGRVRGITPVTKRLKKIMSPEKSHKGYFTVELWRDKKPKRWCVHHIVTEAFIGQRPKSLVVNHIDGDKTNNCLSNLEYVTYAQNSQHAYRIGLLKVTPPINIHTQFKALERAGLSEATWSFGLALAASLVGVSLSEIKV